MKNLLLPLLLAIEIMAAAQASTGPQPAAAAAGIDMPRDIAFAGPYN